MVAPSVRLSHIAQEIKEAYEEKGISVHVAVVKKQAGD